MMANQPDRPNLLFVFSDQQSFDMVGCNGNDQVITPNLDGFARQGVRFNHCVSSCPVCTPYRGMLLSGQHPLYNGAFTNDVQMLSDNGASFGEVLRDANYRTGYIGKWHLHGGWRDRPIPAGPHRHGLDDCFLTNNCTIDFRAGHSFFWNESGEKEFFEEWNVYGQTNQAIEFLDQCTSEQPFALFVSWDPPHDQGLGSLQNLRYEAPDDLMARYDWDAIRLRPDTPDTPQNREDVHGYMAMCTGLDVAFGQLMDKLRERGLDRNTIVVYTSDHGDLLGAHGRPWSKCFPEDEAVRVPLIVSWPDRLHAGQSSDLLVGTLDFMPTILGMMGLSIPEICQGKNLAEHFFSGHGDAVESIPLFYYGPTQTGDQSWHGVYTARYTYSVTLSREKTGEPRNTLYDRLEDPHQQTNLFYSPDHRSIRDRLHRLTLDWVDTFKDPCINGYEMVGVLFGKPECKLHRDRAERALPCRPIDLLTKST